MFQQTFPVFIRTNLTPELYCRLRLGTVVLFRLAAILKLNLVLQRHLFLNEHWGQRVSPPTAQLINTAVRNAERLQTGPRQSTNGAVDHLPCPSVLLPIIK